MKTFLAVFWLSLAPLFSWADDGAAAYQRGDYAQAVELWQSQAQQEGVHADLLSALGNAEWKLGRKGRAILCWERALLLNPRDPVALAGLHHAQGVGGTDRPLPTWTETYASFMTADTWLLLGTLSFWVAVYCIVVPRLKRQPSTDLNERILLLSITLLVLTIPGLWGAHTNAQRAVIKQGEISLRLTPTKLGEPIQATSEGDVVRTDRKFNGHVRVITAEGKAGWVRADEIEPIWGAGLPGTYSDATSAP